LELSNWDNAEATLVGDYQIKLFTCEQEDIALFPVAGHQGQVFDVLITLLDVNVVLVT